MSQRSGMTLIELLVALTLSSMLLVALYTVLINVRVAQDKIKSEFDSPQWLSVMTARLQNDYRNCRSIQVSPREIRIEGYAEFNDRQGRRRSGPCNIRYFISSDESSDWLFRETNSLLVSTKHRELICRDVNRFLAMNELSTDVAPGVFRIQIQIAAAAEQFGSPTGKVDQRETSNRTTVGSRRTAVPEPVTVVTTLVRHGIQ